MSDVLEKTTEAWLGRKLREVGGLWMKFTSPGHSGVPDRILVLRGHTVYVEMKREKGKVSPIQKATFDLMVKAGVSIHVVYGKNGAQDFLNDIKSPAGFVLQGDKTDAGVYEWR